MRVTTSDRTFLCVSGRLRRVGASLLVGIVVLGAPVAADAPSFGRTRPDVVGVPFTRDVGSQPATADAPTAAADIASMAPLPGGGGWQRPAAKVNRLVLLGDSLAQEVTPYLQFLTPGKTFVPKFWGGTAPCDWSTIDLEATRSSVVVISFTGNSLTPCMADGAGGYLDDEALVDRYREDVGTLIDRARRAGARVVLVGQPRRAASFDDDAEVDGLTELYRSFARSFPFVSFVDAGATVEAPDGSFTDRLPCTGFDTDCAADGSTVVRGDGVHFCPHEDTNPCDVWSSGAFRFGLAIAGAANRPQSYE